MDEQQARIEIARAFPELPVHEVTFLGAGMDSDAFLVDGAWVFRFPRRDDVARALAREVALLPKLAPRLPVATPRFTWVSHQSNGRLFAGYRLIDGEPLSAALFGSLSPDEQERVLATFAAFLRGVHGFSLDEAKEAGVEELSTREWVESAWARGQAAVIPLLSPDDGAALARRIEGFLADERNFARTPCLLYADFAEEHVLYDRRARDIAGVIDWGDLSIGDPDFDLLYVRQDHGEGFVRRLLAHDPHPEPARLFEKLRVFDACDHVSTIAAAVEDGDDGDDGEDIGESVAALREILRQAEPRVSAGR